MVAYLACERQLAGAVSQVIGGGLEHKDMTTAAAFLQPLLALCGSCGNLNQIVDLVVRFAESVEHNWTGVWQRLLYHNQPAVTERQ